MYLNVFTALCKDNGRITKTEVGVTVTVLHNSAVLNIFTVKGGSCLGQLQPSFRKRVKTTVMVVILTEDIYFSDLTAANQNSHYMFKNIP